MDKKGEIGKYIAFGLGIGALAGLACIYVPEAAYLTPAFFGFILAAWGAYGIVPAFAAMIAVACVLAGWTSALYLAALVVPASLIIGIIILRKLPWRTAVAASAFAIGVALYLNLCLPSILGGNNPFDGVKAYMKETGDQFLKALESLSVDGARDATATYREIFALLPDYVPQIVMYYVCGTAMFFALIDVVIARGLTKAAKCELRPMTHFALWQLSKQYSYVSLAAVAGTLAVLVIGLENVDAVFAAASCFVLMPLMLMGVCYMEFTLRMSRSKGAGRRVAFYAFALLLLPYSLILMGLVDRFTRVRKHYTTKKPNENP